MSRATGPGDDHFHRQLPTKRMAAGALLFDEAGDLLIVKPSYKPGWEIPGGVVEADESPSAACRREIQEELGLQVDLTELLCVDYNSSTAEYLESLMFVFAAEPLTGRQADAIRLDPRELVAARFFAPNEAVELLGGRLGQRVSAAISGGPGAVYLNDQRPLSQS